MKLIGRIIFWLGWPIWYVYFKLFPRRSRVFVVSGDELLLIKSWLGNDDSWGLPGGGAKKSETVAASAVRELQEEVGIKVDPADLISIGEYLHDKYKHRFTAYFFVLKLQQKPVLKLQRHEISEAAWFDKQSVESALLNTDTRFGLQEYSDKIFE